jgi:hypothetical protein
MKLQINSKKKNAVAIDEKKKIIKKFFFTSDNSKCINEKKGCKWYHKKLFEKEKINLKFNCLTLPFYEGNQATFWHSLLNYKNKTQFVLIHYKKIWPEYSSKKIFPVHGDLTFSNIIFLPNNFDVRFIDWENFQEKQYWGLDICYFLLSTIVLPALSRQDLSINKKELIFFRKIWKNFFKIYNNLPYLKDPINFLKNSIHLPKNNFLNLVNRDMFKKIQEVL